MDKFYLALAVVGLVVTYYFFISFLLENGLNVGLLLAQLFATNISTFFAVDVVITAVTVILFAYQETRRLSMSNWWVYALATLLVGPSFALPLFLYARHGRFEAIPK